MPDKHHSSPWPFCSVSGKDCASPGVEIVFCFVLVFFFFVFKLFNLASSLRCSTLLGTQTENLTHFSLTSSLMQATSSVVGKVQEIFIDPFLVLDTMVRCFMCFTSFNSHDKPVNWLLVSELYR